MNPESITAGEAGDGQRLDYHALNAMLNLYDADGKIQFDADRRAAREYFLQHVNQNTVFFHNLDEKLDYLVEKDYYEREVLDQYARNFVRELFDHAYAKKFRFPTFLGAFTILLREGLEALLIVVAMLAFLRKADRAEMVRPVHWGWITALVAGLATSLALGTFYADFTTLDVPEPVAEAPADGGP